MQELLAYNLRPITLDEIIGQKHIIGEGKILTNLVKNKKIFSIILYGKPGIGKTTIAKALVNDLGMKYRELNAVINNKKDFDIVVEEAKLHGNMILIMDEIHRLNKDKQDLLLPFLESGLITLIGMTTSNPFHSINPAIRSRCHMIELKELEYDDILCGLKRAIQSNLLEGIMIDEEALKYIVSVSGSDLRYAYNLLEIAYYSTSNKQITVDLLKSFHLKSNFFHDKNDEGYYNVLSAFQKSIRGSDVNASLHYLGRLLSSEDLDSIHRRLSVIVYEDIGLANPSMGPKVMAAIAASERLGLPEARIPLSAIVIELALSPKSNSAELAIDAVLNDIQKGIVGDVPEHIKNHSSEYKYPHNYPNSYVKQQYLPNILKNRIYYKPKNNRNEMLLKQTYNRLQQLGNDK